MRQRAPCRVDEQAAVGTVLMTWLLYCRLKSLKAEVRVQGPAHLDRLQVLQEAANEITGTLRRIDLKCREMILPPTQQETPDFFVLDTLDSPKLLQQKGIFAVCGPASHLTCNRVALLNPRLLLRRCRVTASCMLSDGPTVVLDCVIRSNGRRRAWRLSAWASSGPTTTSTSRGSRLSRQSATTSSLTLRRASRRPTTRTRPWSRR